MGRADDAYRAAWHAVWIWRPGGRRRPAGGAGRALYDHGAQRGRDRRFRPGRVPATVPVARRPRLRDCGCSRMADARHRRGARDVGRNSRRLFAMAPPAARCGGARGHRRHLRRIHGPRPAIPGDRLDPGLSLGARDVRDPGARPAWLACRRNPGWGADPLVPALSDVQRSRNLGADRARGPFCPGSRALLETRRGSGRCQPPGQLLVLRPGAGFRRRPWRAGVCFPVRQPGSQRSEPVPVPVARDAAGCADGDRSPRAGLVPATSMVGPPADHADPQRIRVPVRGAGNLCRDGKHLAVRQHHGPGDRGAHDGRSPHSRSCCACSTQAHVRRRTTRAPYVCAGGRGRVGGDKRVVRVDPGGADSLLTGVQPRVDEFIQRGQRGVSTTASGRKLFALCAGRGPLALVPG